MNTAATIAVVIPYYQHQEFIEATLDSVARQTRPVDKVIVVDDGSPVPFQLPRPHSQLNVHTHRQENAGLAHARNMGFGLADTTYVIPLDSDDILCEDFAAETLEIAETTNAAIVYCDIETFGSEAVVYRHPAYDFGRLCLGNYMVATSLIRRSVFTEVRRKNGHGYDPTVSALGGYEDHLFYLEAGAMGLHGVHAPQVLFKYRRRKHSMLQMARAQFPTIRAYMREKMLTVHGIDIGELIAPGEP